MAPGADLGGEPFDMVVSKFVAEHVADPAAFHAAVWRALRPGGLAAHFFPTLPSPPYAVNRLISGAPSRRLLELLQPGSRGRGGRERPFPAYYRWCAGPSRRQYRRLASEGFEVVDYVVLVGHRYYERFPRVQRAADALSRQALRLRHPAISTYTTRRWCCAGFDARQSRCRGEVRGGVRILARARRPGSSTSWEMRDDRPLTATGALRRSVSTACRRSPGSFRPTSPTTAARAVARSRRR